jgi:hypothetical protein
MTRCMGGQFEKRLWRRNGGCSNRHGARGVRRGQCRAGFTVNPEWSVGVLSEIVFQCPVGEDLQVVYAIAAQALLGRAAKEHPLSRFTL